MELDNGRQGYVVCPLIEESEMDLQNVRGNVMKILKITYQMIINCKYFMVKTNIKRKKMNCREISK